MRKSNLMLVAAILVTPLALAEGDHYGDYGDSYNHYDHDYYRNGDLNKDVTKNIYIDNVGNEDNDSLYIDNVGNKNIYINKYNQKNTYTTNFDYEEKIDTYLADSEVNGYVLGAKVTYGGACCKGSPTEVVVDHGNTMYRAFGDASGISMSGQNVGNNSMVQQTTSTNAALVGSGGGVVSPDSGSY